MLTLDAVRAAVLSDQPWKRLDDLVRAEQSAGRKVKEIYDALTDMADEIDRTPGLTEDGSDAFGDTLDALTGICRHGSGYEDTPKTTLPTEEEIANLPRWAQVAFAARCARRVLPLYALYHWPAPKPVNLHLLQLGVDAAESGGDLDTISANQNAVSMIHDGTLAIAQKQHSPAFWSASVATAIHNAIACRLAATNHEEMKSIAFKTLQATTASEGNFFLHPAIRRDFNHLARLAERQKWTDDTLVPPEVFGPLWPEGPPKGWPATEVPARTELALEAFARDRATEQMIEDDVVNLFNALNRYHIARSGVRLTLEQFRSLLPSLVPAEA